MKLDRNINPDGTGKYALILQRKAPLIGVTKTGVMIKHEAIDYGDTPETEFFVIRLKDKYASSALRAYAIAAAGDDKEWSNEILALADKALAYANKRRPD